MLLAGNDSSVIPDKTLPTAVPTAQVVASTLRSSLGDGCTGNSSRTASTCSGLLSPISVTSHAGSQSGRGINSASEVRTVKQLGVAASPSSQPEPHKVVSSVRSATTLGPAGNALCIFHLASSVIYHV